MRQQQFRTALDVFRPAQPVWNDIPTLPMLRYHGYGSLVISDENAKQYFMVVGLKRNPVTHRKFAHTNLCPGLMQELKAICYAVSEIP
jgi:hypothetical protein